MSDLDIKSALENGLNAMTPALATKWGNVPFKPVNGIPYQIVHVLPGTPDNAEYGSNYRAQGIMQISLMYPIMSGEGASLARAELIKATFKRSKTFVKNNVKVVIRKTPNVKNGRLDKSSSSSGRVGDRWMIPIDITYFAHVSN